jgi:YVTN family beta-propeller protein
MNSILRGNRSYFLFLLACVAAMSLVAGAGSTGYRVGDKFVVGGDASWDYISIDSSARRLYVSHGTKVNVLDADTGKTIGEVADTLGVHGIALVPDLGKGFVSGGRADKVSVFDLQTLAHTAEISVGKKPDAIIYDPGTRRIFVGDADSDTMTAINVSTNHVVATIPLGGAPEYIASDLKGTVWVNLEDKNSLVTIDANTFKVRKAARLEGCKAPSSMAIDRASRRLFIGCGNRVLVIVDADTSRVIEKIPIGEHVDATTFDPEAHLIFSSTGDGNITVVHEDSPNKYSLVDTIKTMRGAKTMAFDEKTKNLYLPTVENVPTTATGPPRPTGPGAYKPGRFVVIVVEKER